MGFWDDVPDVGLVPKDFYKLSITSMEKVFTKDDGKYMVKAAFQVMEPVEWKGSFINENYVLGNDVVPGQPDSHVWGSKLLKKCLACAGIQMQDDFDATWLSAKGGLFVGKVIIKEGGDDYDDSNRLKTYFTLAEGLGLIGTGKSKGGQGGSPKTPPVQAGTGGGGPSPVGKPVGMPVTEAPPGGRGPVTGGMPTMAASDGQQVPAHELVRYNTALANGDPGAAAEILAGAG